MRKYFTIIIVVGAFIVGFYPTASRAATTPPATTTVVTNSPSSWFPIVPCGLKTQPAGVTGGWDYTQDCNQCLLILLGKNIIDFTFFGIVPVVGTLMFLIAGFIIIFNARSGKGAGVAKGKEIMTNTAIGIAIILGSWLIANFILKSLAADQNPQTPWYKIECHTGTLKDLVDRTAPQSPGTAAQKYKCNASNVCTADSTGQYTTNTCDGVCSAPTGGVLAIATASLPDATLSTAYSQALSVTGGTAPHTWTLSSGTLPVGLSISGSNISGTPTATGTSTFTIKVVDSSSPTQSVTKQLTIKVNQTATGVQCLQSGLNLCQGASSTGCANTSCAQYATMINNQATGVATASVLKAFMEVESSCNIRSVTGTSFGLMQMTPPIPQIYASRCGVSSGDVNQAWLTNPANAEKSICISAQWINALAASQCGSSIRNLYAGYNGGQAGACAPSVSCAGETSCSNEPKKRWECLYDDTAHTQCNGGTNIMLGYNQTRQGATRIQYCAANPGF